MFLACYKWTISNPNHSFPAQEVCRIAPASQMLKHVFCCLYLMLEFTSFFTTYFSVESVSDWASNKSYHSVLWGISLWSNLASTGYLSQEYELHICHSCEMRGNVTTCLAVLTYIGAGLNIQDSLCLEDR